MTGSVGLRSAACHRTKTFNKTSPRHHWKSAILRLVHLAPRNWSQPAAVMAEHSGMCSSSSGQLRRAPSSGTTLDALSGVSTLQRWATVLRLGPASRWRAPPLVENWKGSVRSPRLSKSQVTTIVHLGGGVPPGVVFLIKDRQLCEML